MLSRTSLPPLRIEPRSSRYYLWLLSVLHFLVLLTLIPSDLYIIIKLVAVLLIVISWRHQFRRAYGLQGPRVVTLALWDEKNLWRIRLGHGQMQNAELLPDSLNHWLLVILNFKTAAGQRYSMPLFRDSLDNDLHRRLRVRLTVYTASLNTQGLEDR